jgi:hypothetical protein
MNVIISIKKQANRKTTGNNKLTFKRLKKKIFQMISKILKKFGTPDLEILIKLFYIIKLLKTSLNKKLKKK